MQRTKKQQLETLISNGKEKKGKNVLKTRGSNPLIQSLEPKLSKSSSRTAKSENDGLKLLLVVLLTVMIAMSVLLDFNIYFNILLGIGATIFIWNLTKKDKIKHEVKVIEQKINYFDILKDDKYQINENIKELLFKIHDDINYLLNLEDLINNNVNHLHYINTCKEKHLNDIVKNLLSSHPSHREEVEKVVLEQLIKINNHMELIIKDYQQDLEKNIKIKEVFKPD